MLILLTGIATATSVQTGMVMYFPCNESGGTTITDYISGNILTTNGTFKTGIQNNACSFNGTLFQGAKGTPINNSPTNDFSYSVWVNHTIIYLSGNNNIFWIGNQSATDDRMLSKNGEHSAKEPQEHGA